LVKGSIESDQLDVGKYAVGWIKTGPKGVLDLTFYSSGETLVNLRNHLNFDMLTEKVNPLGMWVSIDYFERWSEKPIKES
jgi:hypothetical protein